MWGALHKRVCNWHISGYEQTSSCDDADAGYYVGTTASTTQTEYASGTYQPDTAQASCDDADAGYCVGTTASTAQTVCPLAPTSPTPVLLRRRGRRLLRRLDCKHLSDGCPWALQPDTAQSSCDDADAGYYVDSTASASQTACAAGTFQIDTGQTRDDADTGYYVGTTASRRRRNAHRAPTSRTRPDLRRRRRRPMSTRR